MNNKEFTFELSKRLEVNMAKTAVLMSSLLFEMSKQLEEGGGVSISGFGNFEVKKKAERISVNPTTKLRLLVPPKLVLNFKPSNALKEKFK